MHKKFLVLAGSLFALAISPALAKPPPEYSTPPTNGVVLPSGSAAPVQPKPTPPTKILVPSDPMMRPKSKLGNQDALREALRKPGSCMADLSVERIEASKPQNGKTYKMKVVVKNLGTEAVVGGPTDDGGVIQIFLEIRGYSQAPGLAWGRFIGEVTRLEAGASQELTWDIDERFFEERQRFLSAFAHRSANGPVCAYDNNAENDRLGLILAAFMGPFNRGELRSVLVRR